MLTTRPSCGRLARHLSCQPAYAHRTLSIRLRRGIGLIAVAANAANVAETGPTNSKTFKFDYTSLQACTRDLHDLGLVPAKVSSVIQYHPHSLALHLRTPTRSDAHLHVCWNPELSHVGLTDRPPRRGSASESFSFGDQLKRSLGNMLLLDASVPEAWERVLRLSFGETLNGPVLSELYVELMNKHSNVVLCDGRDGSIMLAANQIGQRKSSQRQLQVKRQYELPPVVGGGAPTGVRSASEFKERLCVDGMREFNVSKAMSVAFRGIGPAMASLLVDRARLGGAGGSDGRAVESLSEADWESLYLEFRAWTNDLAGDLAIPANPTNSTDRTNKAAEWVARLAPTPRSPSSSSLESFGEWFQEKLTDDEKTRLQASLTRTLSKTKDKLRKKLASLEKQADVSSEADGTKLKGDLVMSHLHLFKNPTADRAFSIEVQNWETGKTEQIALDETKTIIENAEKFYKQASKLKRGATKVLPLIDECKADVEYLEDNEALLESISASAEGDELDLLTQIELELMEAGFIKKKAIHAMQEKGVQKNKKRAKKSGGSEYKRLESPNGFEVLVGRSSKQNDEVTMKIAKPGDIWMHARGFPGAHVLVRCAQVSAPVEDVDLEFAANLAAYYSKGAALSKVDVIMADPKDISKPRGAKPGQVMVSKERVIVASPDDACVSNKK